MKRNRLRPSLQTFRHKTPVERWRVPLPFFLVLLCLFPIVLSFLLSTLVPSLAVSLAPGSAQLASLLHRTAAVCLLSFVTTFAWTFTSLGGPPWLDQSMRPPARGCSRSSSYLLLWIWLVEYLLPCLPRDPSADTSPPRYPSPSSSLCSPSSSNSIATLKPQPTRTPLPRIPSFHGSSASSMPTRPPLRAPSTLAMILYCSAAPSARCSPCSRLSRRPSSEHCLTNMAGATHCWPA